MGSFSGVFSDCLIAVKPTPTWTYFQTVQEIIDFVISDIQRMKRVVEVVVKDISISKPQYHQMTSFWHMIINVVQKSQNIFLEIDYIPQVIQFLHTYIVANQL